MVVSEKCSRVLSEHYHIQVSVEKAACPVAETSRYQKKTNLKIYVQK